MEQFALKLGTAEIQAIAIALLGAGLLLLVGKWIMMELDDIDTELQTVSASAAEVAALIEEARAITRRAAEDGHANP